MARKLDRSPVAPPEARIRPSSAKYASTAAVNRVLAPVIRHRPCCRRGQCVRKPRPEPPRECRLLAPHRLDAFGHRPQITDMLLDPGGGFEYNGRRYTYLDVRIVWWSDGNPFHESVGIADARRQPAMLRAGAGSFPRQAGGNMARAFNSPASWSWPMCSALPRPPGRAASLRGRRVAPWLPSRRSCR